MTTHELNGFDVPLSRPLLFGVLADYAWPVVEHYRSDLYHDALWIEKYVPDTLPEGEDFTFYWGMDPWGTYIGTELYVSRANRYKVRVYLERGRWKVDMEEVEA